MKSYLSIVFAALLLLPVSALAQTAEDDGSPAEETPVQAGDEAPAEEAPAETEDGESEEDAAEDGEAEPAAEGEAAEEDGAESTDVAPDEDATLEQAPVEAVPPQPVAPTPAQGGADAAGGAATGLTQPSAPSLADDLAAAQEEAEVERDEDVPPPEERQGVQYDPETGRFVEETEQLPWRNSLFLWDHSVGTYTFDPGISDNPYYAMAFSFRPRWYLMEDVSVRLRQDLSIEMTDTDIRTRNREPVLSDTFIDLVHSNLYEFEGIRLGAGARLTLPTSYLSRNQTLIAGTGVNGSAMKRFADVLQGLVLVGSGGYTHRWYSSNVPEVTEAYPCTRFTGDRPFDDQCLQSPGSSNVGNSWTLGLAASLAVTQRVTLGASYGVGWNLAHSLGDGTVPTPTGDVVVEDNSETHWRNDQTFAFEVDYRFYDWLNAAGSIYTFRTGQLDPDGSLRNPFYNPETVVSLTATVTLDQLYTSVRRRTGDDEESTATAQARAENGRAAQ